MRCGSHARAALEGAPRNHFIERRAMNLCRGKIRGRRRDALECKLGPPQSAKDHLAPRNIVPVLDDEDARRGPNCSMSSKPMTKCQTFYANMNEPTPSGKALAEIGWRISNLDTKLTSPAREVASANAREGGVTTTT